MTNFSQILDSVGNSFSTNLETKNINSILEGIKHIDDYGNEF